DADLGGQYASGTGVVAGLQSGPITKSGPGVLSLIGASTFSTNTTSSSANPATNINILEGTLRATAAAMPNDNTVLRFRGGVFELSGGGTINRTLGGSTVVIGAVNWKQGTSGSDLGS